MVLPHLGVHGAGVHGALRHRLLHRRGSWGMRRRTHVLHGTGIKLGFAFDAAEEETLPHVLRAVC